MNISTASHIDFAITSDTSNSDLTSLDHIDCELVFEDQQGHHTFHANPDMKKVILSFLAAL
jgi:hypothetical protein